MLKTLEASQGYQLAYAVRGCRKPRDLERQAQISFDRAPGQQRMLLEGYSQRVLSLQLPWWLSVDLHLTRAWLVEARQQTQDRTLAATRGTDQGYKFAIAYLHVQGTEGSKGLSPPCSAAALEGSRDSAQGKCRHPQPIASPAHAMSLPTMAIAPLSVMRKSTDRGSAWFIEPAA
jgi:hypothetical protein